MLQNITLNPYKAQELLTDFHLLWKCVGFIYLLTNLFCFREGNGAPLQYSCLENPMDRGAW